MRRILVVCTAFLMLSTAAVARDGPAVQIFAGGGLAIPVTPDVFKDGWKEGYDVGGGVGVRLTNNLSIRGQVSYDRFALDEGGVFSLVEEDLGPDAGEIIDLITIDGAETTITSFSGEVKFSFVGDTARVSPYVFGGGGGARVTIGETRLSADVPFFGPIEETVESMSQTKGMAVFGGGVDIPTSESFAIFVEGRYQLTFLDEDTSGHAVFRAGIQAGF